MSNISSRMDALPITTFHKVAACALAFAYFFELADLNTFAYAAPAIVSHWKIPVHDVALITSFSFGGMFIGGASGGLLADRFGRKRAFILSILVYTLFSLLNAISWDVFSLAAFRFLTGIGLSSMTVIANVYISEFFPARLRGKVMGVIFTLGLVGIPATAWVARLVVPVAPWAWRLVFVWGSLGLLAIPFALRLIESPRWLLMKGRFDEARRALEKLERAAGRTPETGAVVNEPATNEAAAQSKASVRDLLAPGYRAQTIGLSLIWIFQTFGFYGFVAWVPTLLVERGFSVAHSLEYASLIAICNPIGAWLASGVVERFERKWIVAVDALVIAVSGVAYGLAPSPVFIVIFGAMVTITIQLMNATLYIYTPESYPTHLRSMGTGFCYGLGRLTNVIGPFIVSTLYVGFGYMSVFTYISVCWLLVALVVALIGPRTTGRSLESVAPSETIVLQKGVES
ncbi:MFS transporter [Paraburkholderia silvatlantica]|uniref:MFS transporter n=1 Tax=Paraburkholderia silvatlantica TaxID=321895 RepID=A0A2U1AGK1_9BURK|nr:MFS transporter [Paraburkholderia silvatlantica]MBB2928954.1 putative MFS transporter [Paraburkholderia silvatlantica]PVY35533.1 putative MFS transporter [Paraburkholderia silvatlantica]PXW41175.1 putative MFS transporter [Paraburkholderia silvatlantica]PYE27640.1 putative MFS transporter [Paraburkholderia silvatlantica]TDQ76257.1 putative MFS transporter [Paraburkholderia silvatlantica]